MQRREIRQPEHQGNLIGPQVETDKTFQNISKKTREEAAAKEREKIARGMISTSLGDDHLNFAVQSLKRDRWNSSPTIQRSQNLPAKQPLSHSPLPSAHRGLVNCRDDLQAVQINTVFMADSSHTQSVRVWRDERDCERVRGHQHIAEPEADIGVVNGHEVAVSIRYKRSHSALNLSVACQVPSL